MATWCNGKHWCFEPDERRFETQSHPLHMCLRESGTLPTSVISGQKRGFTEFSLLKARSVRLSLYACLLRLGLRTGYSRLTMPPKKKGTSLISQLLSTRGISYANESGVWLERSIIKATWSLPSARLSTELDNYFQERIGSLAVELERKLATTLGKRKHGSMVPGSLAIGSTSPISVSDEDAETICSLSKPPLIKGQTTLNFGKRTSLSCGEDPRLLTPTDLRKDPIDPTSSLWRLSSGETVESERPGE